MISRADAPAVINWKTERAALDAFMARMPFRVPLDQPVSRLAAGEKQKLEILKQLYLGHRFLILDEPTSVLTPGEADEMLGHVRALTQAGEITRPDDHPQVPRSDGLRRRVYRPAARQACRRRQGGRPHRRRHGRDDDRRGPEAPPARSPRRDVGRASSWSSKASAATDRSGLKPIAIDGVSLSRRRDPGHRRRLRQRPDGADGDPDRPAPPARRRHRRQRPALRAPPGPRPSSTRSATCPKNRCATPAPHG